MGYHPFLNKHLRYIGRYMDEVNGHHHNLVLVYVVCLGATGKTERIGKISPSSISQKTGLFLENSYTV